MQEITVIARETFSSRKGDRKVGGIFRKGEQKSIAKISRKGDKYGQKEILCKKKEIRKYEGEGWWEGMVEIVTQIKKNSCKINVSQKMYIYDKFVIEH